MRIARFCARFRHPSSRARDFRPEPPVSATPSAADLLLRARDPACRIAALPDAVRPVDAAAAYAIQREVMAALGPIGGWKTGAAGPDAAPSGAPMPLSGIAASPARMPATGFAIEAEVAFRLGRDLPPRPAPYGREEIVAALATAHPAIEWLESRFVDPDVVDPLSLLADFATHGGFVWGPGVADWHGIVFATETVTQSVDGAAITRTGNPGGDMIRMVQWLANAGAVWAGGLFAGQFVTCGSWTGKAAARAGQSVVVRFPSLGEVALG
jgi:2-keto-4-pentenoate hydratase